MTSSLPPTSRRRRALLASTATLTLVATGALAAPATTLAAQGDDEVVISVIERATPSVVTIQTESDPARRGGEPCADASPAPENEDRG